MVGRGTRRLLFFLGQQRRGESALASGDRGWGNQLSLSREHHRFTSGILGERRNWRLMSAYTAPTPPPLPLLANMPFALPQCAYPPVPRQPLLPQLTGHSPVELECCILPVATQFLCTLLALPGLLRLRCGGQGVSVGPQDADGGGGEVCEGLLALLLPPTALLPRVTPALLISVPALKRTMGEVKRPAPALDDREVCGMDPPTLSIGAQRGRVPNLARDCSARSAPLGQMGPKPTVFLWTLAQ